MDTCRAKGPAVESESPRHDRDCNLPISDLSYKEKRERGNDKRLDLVPLGELLRRPTVGDEWLADGLLVAAGTSIIAAKPKVGKSTVLRSLALAVARGEPFFGRDTSAGTVVYLALEDKVTQIVSSFIGLGALDDPVYIHLGSAYNCMGDLRRNIIALSPKLVIIDPVFRMLAVKDSNEYMQVTRAIEQFTTLARETNAHICLAHHMGKRGEENGDGVLGSTALFGAVDCLITLAKRGPTRFVTSIQRYGDDLPETVLNMDPVSGAISLGFSRWETLSESVGGEILGLLADGDATEDQIKSALAKDNNLVAKSLRGLVEGGQIQRHGSGRRGSPFVYSLTIDGQRSSILDDVDAGLS